MITLSRHIEILLLEHDCVIIPGLGGFIANQVSARICDTDNLFLPPYRSIGFNKELTVNDGLLVQSYMQAYDAAYPEAYLQMEKEINEMIMMLDTTGSYTLNGIGTLSKNIEEGITFTAIESGVLTPELYGLYSIETLSLEEAKRNKEIQKSLNQTNILPIQTETEVKAAGESKGDGIKDQTEEKPEDQKKENSKKNNRGEVIIKLQKRWVEIAAAAAASVILFFLFTFPSLKSSEELSDTCVASTVYIGNPEPTEAPKQQMTSTVTKSGTNASALSANTSIQTSRNANQQAQAKTESATGGKSTKATDTEYVIVMASCVSAKNAQLFIDNLNGEGFKEARFVSGKINRVVYASYASHEAAAAALSDLRQQSQSFKEAWVLQMK